MLQGALLLVLLGILPLAGRAQARLSGALPDSATAIRQLFWQRRQAGGLGLAVGCGSVAAGPHAATAPESSRMAISPTAVAGLGPSCSVLAFVSRLRYSVRREQQALRCLARHQPLPGYVQRGLGPVLASR